MLPHASWLQISLLITGRLSLSSAACHPLSRLRPVADSMPSIFIPTSTIVDLLPSTTKQNHNAEGALALHACMPIVFPVLYKLQGNQVGV